MKAYLSLIRIRFLNGLQYRTAALAGIATQFAWGGLEILLFVALHSTNTDTFPMEMSALSSYIWLQQAFLALFAPWMADNELFQMVVTGNVAYELCRPLDLYRHWFCRTLALRLSRTVLRCLPILLVAALLPAPYGLSLPASPLAGLLFVLSALLGALVVTSYNMLIYASAFYTTNANGMRAILSSLSDLLAGGLIDLGFTSITSIGTGAGERDFNGLGFSGLDGGESGAGLDADQVAGGGRRGDRAGIAAVVNRVFGDLNGSNSSIGAAVVIVSDFKGKTGTIIAVIGENSFINQNRIS